MPELRTEAVSAVFAAFVALIITFGIERTAHFSVAYYEGRLIMPFSN